MSRLYHSSEAFFIKETMFIIFINRGDFNYYCFFVLILIVHVDFDKFSKKLKIFKLIRVMIPFFKGIVDIVIYKPGMP